MKQLRGSDAYHLAEERPSQHMHTMKVMVVAPEKPLDPGRVRGWAERAVPAVPPLRWRVAPVPGHLGRPVWVDAGPPAIDEHLTFVSAGGDSLDDLVGQLASEPLSRRRPLWHMWFVSGLDAGRAALVLKLHHALADGGASVRILEELFGARPAPGPAPAEPPPSRLALLRHAAGEHVRTYRSLPSVVARSVRSLRAGQALGAADDQGLVKPFTAPPTRFNQPLRPARAYADVTVPLRALTSAKDAFGVTVNDVFLALCGGAIRRYLERRGELPAQPMTAAVPVSIRADGDDDYGNRTAFWYVTLGTDVADPVHRVGAVRRSTAAARASWAPDPRLPADWQDYYALYRILSVRMIGVGERLTRHPVLNAIVSNIRGPAPLELDGEPVVAVRSMGPLVGSHGINLTGWSYGGDFSVGIHVCRERVPDVERIAADFRDEVDELSASIPSRA